MMRTSLVGVVLALAVQGAHAETNVTLRLGLAPIDLQASPDTPLFGADMSRTVDRYNAAAMRTGASRIQLADLGIAETLYTIAPGVELGGRHLYFRLEAPIGLGDRLTAIGVGVYPLNVRGQLKRGLVGYASFGGTASWLDREGDGDIGGLLIARGALGARVGRHVTFELGVSPFAVGGTINNQRIADLEAMREMPEQPDDLLAAGESRGLVDVSVGVTF
jgi:hypothetical protein